MGYQGTTAPWRSSPWKQGPGSSYECSSVQTCNNRPQIRYNFGPKSAMSDKDVTLSHMWHVLQRDVSEKKSFQLRYTVYFGMVSILESFGFVQDHEWWLLRLNSRQWATVFICHFPLSAQLFIHFCVADSFIQDHSTNGIQWWQRRHALMEAPLFSYWHAGSRPNWASFTEDVLRILLTCFFNYKKNNWTYMLFYLYILSLGSTSI